MLVGVSLTNDVASQHQLASPARPGMQARGAADAEDEGSSIPRKAAGRSSCVLHALVRPRCRCRRRACASLGSKSGGRGDAGCGMRARECGRGSVCGCVCWRKRGRSVSGTMPGSDWDDRGREGGKGDGWRSQDGVLRLAGVVQHGETETEPEPAPSRQRAQRGGRVCHIERRGCNIHRET